MLQKQQHQQQQQPSSRSKPAVPAKPTNIPPIPQQILKDSCTAALHNRTKARINQKTVGLSATTNATGRTSTISTTIPTSTSTTTIPRASIVPDKKSDNALPSSPNMSFTNDCCGMLLAGSSSKHDQDHIHHQSQSAIINNNNNNNNNNNTVHHQNTAQMQYACSTVGESVVGGSISPPTLSASSSLSMSCNKIVQSLNCTCHTTPESGDHPKQHSNDGIVASSTVSSCSGGFRDTDFLPKQAAYAAVQAKAVISTSPANSSNHESPKKHHTTTFSTAIVTTTVTPTTSNTSNISTQKLQFMQTSKQIDQMLAQRLVAPNVQQHQLNQQQQQQQLPLTGPISTTTTTKLISTSLIGNSSTITPSSTIAAYSSTTSAPLVKKRMSNSYGSSADTAIFYHPHMLQQHQQQSSLDSSTAITSSTTTTTPTTVSTINEQSALGLQFSKLQEEMKQQCKIIQDKHLIERRQPQQHYRMSNRSQPAIGLKQTPKSRPTIFGTVASDQSPKDSINRKGFPQTTTTNCSGKSIDKIQNQLSSKHPNTTATISSSPNVAVGQPQHHTSLIHPQNPSRYQHQPQDHHHYHHHHRRQQHHPGQQSNQHSVDNEDNALVYRDGNLISGPLDTLIQHMVPTSDYYPDRSYLFAFLLSARLFIRPHELLAKICQLCDEQQDLSCSCCCSCSTSEHRAEDTVDHAYQKPQNNQLILEHHHHQHHHCYHPPCDEGGGADAKPGTDCCSFDIAELDCCRRLRTFAQHFVRLLAEWIDTFPYDFRDERLMQHVRSMTRKCISIDNSLRKDVQTMLQDLLQRLTVLEKYEEFLLTLSQTIGSTDGPNNIADLQSQESVKSHTSTVTHSKPSVLTIQNNLHGTAGESSSPPTGGVLTGGGVQQQQQQQLATSSSASSTSSILSSGGGGLNPAASIDISQLCPSPTLIAHQLTHIELERLSHIGPEEFVQAFAKENPHLEQSFSDMKKTRNLESYVQWFNRLSYLVATEIVKHPKKKQRVRIVEYWIEIARECFNIGNFNSLMAIIAGLNMSPISRLKKTWSKVQSAKFLVLEHQMDPSSNFNSYRSTLKAAMWRSAGATDERERIVIPFFSLLVKDLYFLNEGCSNKLANGHINFEKFWQLAKQVTEFIAWKQVTCPFEKLPKVIMFLQTSNILNENKLAIASFECEPPDNNHEKDRFKSLKSEQQNLQQHSHQ